MASMVSFVQLSQANITGRATPQRDQIKNDLLQTKNESTMKLITLGTIRTAKEVFVSNNSKDLLWSKFGFLFRSDQWDFSLPSSIISPK